MARRGRGDAPTLRQPMNPRCRLDQSLVSRGLVESREQAQRAILAGRVQVNGQTARKASDRVVPSDEVVLTAAERYVSRGGHKLEHALRRFQLEVQGIRALDIGASTGGFTDCLLQHGAGCVHAVDVGRAQLAWRLRQDPRVVVWEGVNARFLDPDQFPAPFQPFDLAVVDCSFISLRLVLPPVVALVRDSGNIVALVKPQFEAGREEASRGGGVILDPEVHRRVLAELQVFVGGQPRLRWQGHTESPLLGPAGNKEFLVLLGVGVSSPAKEPHDAG